MQYQQYYPLVLGFLLACAVFGFWIRDIRMKIAAVDAAIVPVGTIGEINIYSVAKAYLEPMPALTDFPEGTLAVKSARAYRNGEFHSEFYGDFMRIYRVDDGQVVDDQYVIFHWLPKALLAEYSTAELYEHIGLGWINEVTWKRLCEGVVHGGC